MKATPPTSPAESPAEAPTAVRPTLLLLEDDRATSDAMMQLLQHYEFEVHLARTVLEAMPLLPLAPKFAVLDVMLPDGSGERILDLIRRRKLPTKVAVVTACRDRDRLTDVIRLKPDLILGKPIDFLKLLEFLRAA